MNIYAKLLDIQKKLRAPKGQWNDYSKFNYRSCEDILEAVKPLLAEHKLAILIADEIEQIGERYYLKATVTLIDADDPEQRLEISSLARESLTKKGMDDSQVTGATSSYARKYCLNGLFAIDDTKDPDTPSYPTYQGNQGGQGGQPTRKKPVDTRITVAQRKLLVNTARNLKIEDKEVIEILGGFGYENSISVDKKDFDKIMNELEARKKI